MSDELNTTQQSGDSIEFPTPTADMLESSDITPGEEYLPEPESEREETTETNEGEEEESEEETSLEPEAENYKPSQEVVEKWAKEFGYVKPEESAPRYSFKMDDFNVDSHIKEFYNKVIIEEYNDAMRLFPDDDFSSEEELKEHQEKAAQIAHEKALRQTEKHKGQLYVNEQEKRILNHPHKNEIKSLIQTIESEGGYIDLLSAEILVKKIMDAQNQQTLESAKEKLVTAKNNEVIAKKGAKVERPGKPVSNRTHNYDAGAVRHFESIYKLKPGELLK